MNLKVKSIEIVEPFKHLQVRYERMAALADGGEVSLGDHREAFSPGADVSGAAPEVRDLAATLWTPEIVAAFRAAQAEAGN
ncbi:MAG: hypothetical protein EpisKO_15410 [Epibacterium sp.]